MRRIALALVAAAGVAFAAVPSSAGTKINVFSGVSPVFAPPFVAFVKGYFKEEGLDVTVRTFQAGVAAAEAFRSGGAQFLVTGDQPMIMMGAGGDAVIVTQFSDNNHMVFMMGPKTVKGPADLKGKKIGLFRKSASEFMLQQYLKSGGLTVKDVEMVHLAPFDQVPALVKGDVFAVSLWKPFDQKIMGLSDKFKILATSGDLGYSFYSGLLASRKYLESAPKGEMDAFMRAIKKGSDFLTNNPKEAFEAVAKFTKLPVKLVEHVSGGQKWDLVSDNAFRAQMRNIEQFLQGLGILKSPVDWNKAADWSYIKKLDPNLVKGM